MCAWSESFERRESKVPTMTDWPCLPSARGILRQSGRSGQRWTLISLLPCLPSIRGTKRRLNGSAEPNFRGCDLEAEWFGQFSIPDLRLRRRAPACAVESPKLEAWGCIAFHEANVHSGHLTAKACKAHSHRERPVDNRKTQERYLPGRPALALRAAAARPPSHSTLTNGIILKTPVRYQSRLLIRRCYKPDRAQWRPLGVTFRPTQRFVVPVAGDDRKDEPAATTPRTEIARSG